MGRKTGVLALALLFSLVSSVMAGQDSPLKWPVPPPGPPREPVLPSLLVGVEELPDLLAAGAVPLDARGAAAHERGHLPGAVAVWSQAVEISEEESVRSLLAERGITGERTVVLYGDQDREAIARLFWLLRRAGCPEVRIFNGTLAAWLAAGHPLETGASRQPAAEFHQPARETVAVDSGWVADTLGQPGTELLDVRDAHGWERWETPPTFGAGHIPRSLPFEPRHLLPPDDGWPEPAELRRRLAALGPRPGDPVSPDSTFVLYGEDSRDPRTALGYLLFTLAGLEARIFTGGWREWTANGSRPIVQVVSAAKLASLLKQENPDLARDRPPRKVILLDLRDRRDFQIGHLPGARNLPYRSFQETFEKVVEEGWPGADRATVVLALYCYGPACIRSRDAGAQAARLGFRDILWFRGGVQEWRSAGLPLPTTTASEERASPATGAARRSP